MNGKLLDGKVIKVEPAGKPSYANHGRGTEPPISRSRVTRVTQRSLSYGRGGNDGTRGHSSSERNFGGSRYSPNFNMSSPRRPLPVKRNPFPRIGSPPPKRSNRSAAVGSSFKVREQGSLSCGRETYETMPRRNPVSFERDDYASPNANTYSTKDRGDHLSSRDIKGYAGAPRAYAYNSYRGYYSKEKRTTKSYSDRGGYDGSHGRNDHSSGGSYQDTGDCCAENHHTAPTTREFTRTFGGNSRYDDNRSSQHECRRRDGNAASSQKDTHFRGREYGVRQTGPLPSQERGYQAPHESQK
ncbi:RNA-binding motif protein, X chromosome-like isoform 2-T2 [Thomomys bottae]